MNKYEMMVLYKPELKEAEVKKSIDELKKKITDLQGKDVEEDYWGLKELSYTIDKYTQAYYTVIRYELDSSSANQLSMYLNKQQDNILRNLITRI